MARSGFTLSVFAVAAAKAALLHLLNFLDTPGSSPATSDDNGSLKVSLDLSTGNAPHTAPELVLSDAVEINIEQVALLSEQQALAIARSDPGDNLDLTRNTPIWAQVQLVPRGPSLLILQAGEGLGRTEQDQPAIYRYAQHLFATNIEPLIPPHYTAVVRVILPEGRRLAKRTSNESFGVLEGLALLGTSGISQPLAATDALDRFRQSLRERARSHRDVVFCLGSNGHQVAHRLGIASNRILKTANWVGAMLVEAALLELQTVLLIGYHGKLVKLAGGIFHTSSHLADGKLEILTSAALRAGADAELGRSLLQAPTAEDARLLLVKLGWADRVFEEVSKRIEQNATAYVHKYSDRPLEIGVILFDRSGEIVMKTATAQKLIAAVT